MPRQRTANASYARQRLGVASVPEAESFPRLDARAVVEEFFYSITEEVVAEVNLPLPTLSPPMLLGFLANHTTTDRRSAVFESKCETMLLLAGAYEVNKRNPHSSPVFWHRG